MRRRASRTEYPLPRLQGAAEQSVTGLAFLLGLDSVPLSDMRSNCVFTTKSVPLAESGGLLPNRYQIVIPSRHPRVTDTRFGAAAPRLFPGCGRLVLSLRECTDFPRRFSRLRPPVRIYGVFFPAGISVA
jgi:hypothetical protein